MTGIERLRKIAHNYRNLSKNQRYLGINVLREAGLLSDIADQIERERVSRMRVLSVVTEMEHHILGHEGMEDSPVARWARELREALGGDGRDPAADVSMSAYDLLPADERDAIAWVRDHGGLDGVKKLLDWVVGHCSTRQQLDFDFWLSGRVMHELGFEEDVADRDEVERRLLARLMPDGYEWPRYESGEPVQIGDVVSDVEVRSVVFRDGGILLSDCTSVPGWGTWRSYKEPIKRPAPKVLDADGVEVEVGDDLYSVEGMLKFHVSAIDKKSGRIATEAMFALDKWADPKMYTHRAPVLAADGKPLREGEMVYSTENGDEFTVIGIDAKSGDVHIRWGYDFEDKTGTIAAELLTHERPVADTWERIEEDARSCTCVMEAIDLVRRAKKLAEKED